MSITKGYSVPVPYAVIDRGEHESIEIVNNRGASLGYIETGRHDISLATAEALVYGFNCHDDLVQACEKVKLLWDKHGLGDSDAESEPVYELLRDVLARAKDGGK